MDESVTLNKINNKSLALEKTLASRIAALTGITFNKKISNADNVKFFFLINGSPMMSFMCFLFINILN